MSTRYALLVLAFAGLSAPALAAELITGNRDPLLSANRGGVMPAMEAFALKTVVEADGDLVLSWEMPPAYYLYRKSLGLQHGGTDLTAALELPEAKTVSDEFFGESEVYFERLLARLPADALKAESGATIELQLTYQGCFENVYCYPPQHQTLSVTLP